MMSPQASMILIEQRFTDDESSEETSILTGIPISSSNIMRFTYTYRLGVDPASNASLVIDIGLSRSLTIHGQVAYETYKYLLDKFPDKICIDQ